MFFILTNNNPKLEYFKSEFNDYTDLIIDPDFYTIFPVSN